MLHKENFILGRRTSAPNCPKSNDYLEGASNCAIAFIDNSIRGRTIIALQHSSIGHILVHPERLRRRRPMRACYGGTCSEDFYLDTSIPAGGKSRKHSGRPRFWAIGAGYTRSLSRDQTPPSSWHTRA